MARGGLGGGLGSLFENNSSEVQMKKTLRISELEPNRNQPRKNFDNTSITALAESIKEHGVLQPILVRPLPLGNYQIVAGERRWRAAKMVGLDEVPVIIRELSELETAQIALIENLQRENLNPIEEAQAFQRLQNEFDMKQEAISKTVGCSRSTVTNALRLLKLPKEVQDMLAENKISAGHAKALLSFSDEEMIIKLAQKVCDDFLTVRQIEKLAIMSQKSESETESKIEKPVSYYGEVEQALHTRLNRKVKVQFKKNKGSLILEFYNEEDLKELANLLSPD
ncbi:MAG: ParB/RepB/Spo0J family partition protein [Oscillospiraceae bacterium]|nr:ParB/RepB/Spo0J family partition protein [Oscillospiraceae bacterium]MDE6657197.1 ParB/RepB/Spo0J family partition protein [Oscillospiraceae bacterium]